MNSATDPLLEALAIAYPLGLRVSDIYENLVALGTDVPSDNTFYRARDKLIENGYIERIEGATADLYRITDAGMEYIEGEIQGLDLDLDEE